MPISLIKLIGMTEIAIGTAALAGIALTPAFAFPKKPLPVLVFVLFSALGSIFLGGGILRRWDPARRAIIFFSGYIILTKILLFTGLIELKGEIVPFPPAAAKNAVSFVYHLFIFFFFGNSDVRDAFKARP